MHCHCCRNETLTKIKLREDTEPGRVLSVLKNDSLCKNYRDSVARIVASFYKHPYSRYSNGEVAFALGWVSSSWSTHSAADAPDEYDHTNLPEAPDQPQP